MFEVSKSAGNSKGIFILFTFYILGIRSYPLVSPELKFTVNKTWDNQTTKDGAEIFLSFQVFNDVNDNKTSTSLQILIDAPFYNEPQVPGNFPKDQPTLGLWNYEVVEAFFLGNDNEYLEIELAPSGHFLLLFLKGKHNLITYNLPLTNYSTSFSSTSGRWTGKAYIPGEYFPCNVTKFNAYAIHKSDPNRVYMSLFPVPTGQFERPNFHQLKAFEPINLGSEVNPTSKCLSV